MLFLALLYQKQNIGKSKLFTLSFILFSDLLQTHFPSEKCILDIFHTDSFARPLKLFSFSSNSGSLKALQTHFTQYIPNIVIHQFPIPLLTD